MSENGLPKATMVNFIKGHISDKRKVSAEFTTMLLDLSKQFIDKVSANANQICEREGKKTINNEHFFGALQAMGMGDVIKELQKTDENIKAKQQKKNEDKLRVQENIQRMNKLQSSQNLDKVEKQKVPLLEQNSKYKPIDLGVDDDDDNFGDILEKDLDMDQEN